MITSFDYKGQEIKFEITDPNDYLQKFWLRKKFYELGMLMFIEARWKKRTKIEELTFIDVGACIGNHTVFFSKVIGAKVYAIEPVDENCRLIWNNMVLNAVESRVHPWFHFAAGDQLGFTFLKLDKTGNSGMHKISEDGDTWAKMITIDHIIDDPFTVHLIKIDVEGYNIPVLEGAKLMIKQNHPEIYIECQTPEELQEVEDFLLPLGYKRWETHFNATPTYFFYH